MQQTFSFLLEATDGNARAGTLMTPHGNIQTPIFMPVATRSAIKGATIDQIEALGAQIFLVNNYHSYLRPGSDVIASFGGLHRFMDASLPILTDSGGFQVFSLGSALEKKTKAPLVKITEEGVHFRSYLDGSKHYFSPENVMDMQSDLGGDIIMAFDECAAGDSSYEYARGAMERTHRWAERSKHQWCKNEVQRAQAGQHPQMLFGIIQGVIYDDLRRMSAEYIDSLDLPGVAIGGLSVGESKEDMYHILDVLAPLLPEDKPHYLMGVGTPEDLVEGIFRGIDMFDCVLATRLGRHGEIFTSFGNMKMKNAIYTYSQEKIPMLPEFETQISKRYSLGYLRHLIHVGEATGGLLLSLHNIEYLLLLVKKARQAILAGTFEAFRANFWQHASKNISKK